MTDKTAIEKIHALRRNAENDMPAYDFGWDDAIDKVLETITTLDAEKPAEDNYMVLLDAIFDAITENGIMNHPTEGMFLTSESIDVCLPIIQQFAETYHAERCAACKERK